MRSIINNKKQMMLFADDHCREPTIMSGMNGKRFLSKEKSGKSVVIARRR